MMDAHADIGLQHCDGSVVLQLIKNQMSRFEKKPVFGVSDHKQGTNQAQTRLYSHRRWLEA